MENIRLSILEPITPNQLQEEIQNFNDMYFQENISNGKTYLGLDFDDECQQITNILIKNISIKTPNFKNLLENLNQVDQKLEIEENINNFVYCSILPQKDFEKFDTKKVETMILDYFYQLYGYLVMMLSGEEKLTDFFEKYEIKQNTKTAEHIKSYKLFLILSTKNYIYN